MKTKTPDHFLNIPPEFTGYGSSGIVILPVPFDKTSTWIKGADKGPKAIIEASQIMELYDIETGSEAYRRGIHTEKGIIASSSELMVEDVYKKVKKLIDDKKFAVVLGGEHSVSIGAIKAHSSMFEDLSVLHLDAHSDARDSYKGSKYNHACVIARAKEAVKNIVSVGIRSMDSSELNYIDPSRIFYAHDIHNSTGWIKKVLKKLSRNVYITIDLDVFDPGIMPSTGTPEPGGLGWYQVISLLRAVSEKKNIIGFDAVELCPSADNKAPDFLAAKLIYKLLSYKFRR